MNRRNLLKLGAMAPVAAMSQPVPHPVYEQRLPLVTLPVDAPAGLGVGAPWQSDDDIPAMLEKLRPAWWYDWRWEQCGSPGYVPMIWSDAIWAQSQEHIAAMFARRPDLFWLLWNEPEIADGQANMAPDLTATLTAEIAAYGIRYAAPGVSLTASGYRWMDAYMAAGGPVPPVWHVHIYWCLEPEQWAKSWLAWVHWMQANDCVRPTIVSETNAWTEGDFGQRAMLEYLAEAVADVELLRAVAWFATRYNEGTGHPHLLNEDGDLTSVGRTFAAVRSGR